MTSIINSFYIFPFQWLFQVDISSQTQMLALQERLQSLPDVAGIVHTAMVLRDEYIKELTFQRFNEVMGPKIKGKTANQSNFSDPSRLIVFSSCRSRCFRHRYELIITGLKTVLKKIETVFFINSNENDCFSIFRLFVATSNELRDGSGFLRDVFVHGVNRG